MSNVKILNRNYVDSENYQSMTYSSQIAAAPASNVIDRVRRNKVWRTAGYWNIVSTNKSIVFRETIGVDLTASIVEDEYTTDAAFLTAVKTALDAAGASTYTVERVTATGLIKITSNGSGGGGIFQIMWTDVGSTAATILGYSTLSNDTGALNYTADTVRLHTEEWIKIDMGSASNPAAAVIIGKRNSAIGISSTATVKIQGNATDTWTTPAVDTAMTWSEENIFSFNSSGFGAYRYWRILIQDYDNPNGYLEISNIYIGEAYEPTQGAVQFPFNFEYEDLSTKDVSDNGVIYSNIKQQTISMILEWFGLTKTECETLRDFVDQYGTYYPFFISLDPNAVFSSSVSKWVKFCRFQDPPRFTLESPNVFSSTWNLREEL